MELTSQDIFNLVVWHLAFIAIGYFIGSAAGFKKARNGYNKAKKYSDETHKIELNEYKKALRCANIEIHEARREQS